MTEGTHPLETVETYSVKLMRSRINQLARRAEKLGETLDRLTHELDHKIAFRTGDYVGVAMRVQRELQTALFNMNVTDVIRYAADADVARVTDGNDED